MKIEIGGKSCSIAKLTLKELRSVRAFGTRANAPGVTAKEIDALTAEALEIIAQVLRRADAECVLTADDLENCMTADDLKTVFLKLLEISTPDLQAAYGVGEELAMAIYRHEPYAAVMLSHIHGRREAPADPRT